MVIKRAATLFDQAAHTRVNDAVRDAESRTVAEIIPVVATASGRYDRADDMVGLLAGAVAMLAVYVCIAQANAPGGDWRAISIAWACAALLTALAGGFVVGVYAAPRMPWLRRLIVTRRAMATRVETAAAAAFYDNRVRDTADAAGVLVYISLYERTAVVLADHGALKALGQATINRLCADLVGKLHTADITNALCTSIAAIGDALAEPLPRRADDVNELPDCLVLID